MRMTWISVRAGTLRKSAASTTVAIAACAHAHLGQRDVVCAIRFLSRVCINHNWRNAAISTRAVPSTVLSVTLFIFAAASAHAQDMEPRAYSNSPVGLNFVIAGYAYSQGKIAFDPSLPIADAQFHSNTGVFAYARSLDAWGKSAKFDVILPYSSFSGHALLDSASKEREMSGLGDPLFRFSVNFYGAPALSMKEFGDYQQDVIVGASLQVSAPLGQYDNSKLVNLGNNRWSFKAEAGISKAWGPWILELTPAATFYTDNTDFNKGGTLAQAPLYSMQGHLVYSFRSGIWLAVDGTYFAGARTTINGIRAENRQTNTRAGLTLALPVDRHNSVKFYASSGTSSRTASGFDAVGIAWQYRWGGGY